MIPKTELDVLLSSDDPYAKQPRTNDPTTITPIELAGEFVKNGV